MMCTFVLSWKVDCLLDELGYNFFALSDKFSDGYSTKVAAQLEIFAYSSVGHLLDWEQT